MSTDRSKQITARSGRAPRRPPPRATFAAALTLVACATISGRAAAQACCAGGGVITPGRLAMDESALAGVQLKAAGLLGSFDAHGRFFGASPGSEIDLEQDLFGSIRFLRRGQASLLLPLVETRRAALGASELGGGFGDMNASVRYDFYDAGELRHFPGIALLAGVTLPTGVPPESATTPLATGATGIGAFQGNLGVALEQIDGPLLFNATALVAKRLPRSVQGIDETLGTQWTLLFAVAHVWRSGVGLAYVTSLTLEGDAEIDGRTAPDTARRIVSMGLSGVVPLGGAWRVQGSLSANPPMLGRNQPATGGFTAGLLRTLW